MARTFTDVSDVFNKSDNEEAKAEIEAEGVDEEEYLDAAQWNKVGKAIGELQDEAAKSITKIVRGSASYTADDDGTVTFPSEAASVGVSAQESTDSYIETSGTVTLHLHYTSIEGGTDTGNTVNIEIQKYANGNYTTMLTFTEPSMGLNSSTYKAFDITSACSDGSNQIRVHVTDPTTGVSGNLVFQSIVKASLSVECAMDWHKPITDLASGIPLSYAIYGTGVSKILNVRIYDNSQNTYRELTYTIGTTTYPVANPWSATSGVVDLVTDAVKVLTHGVHTIEAWVSCTVDGTTYSSPHIKNQIMVVADATSTKAYLMMQQTVGITEGTEGDPYIEAENYVQSEELYAYAVYNPANPVDGTKVTFSIDDATGDVNCFKLEQMALNNTKYTVPATLQVEGATLKTTSYVYLSAVDENGDNFLSTKSGAKLIIAVSNDYDFAPTSGADFYINPSNRNNSEENPARILNAAKSNAVVTSTFENFNFDDNDGWIQNSDGIRVLRIRAGQKLTIEYDPFAEFTDAANNNKTPNPSANVSIEMDVMVKNVTNETDPIINIANDVIASGKFVGVRMCPLEGSVMTTSQTTYGQQNFGWREDTREHIVVNICSAIYADYSSRSTIPLVRVFVNGNPYREFMFALKSGEWGTDKFKIELGQAAAELDVYNLRVYKKAVSAKQVMQNYKSVLPTSASKLSFDDANDILSEDGTTISYEKAREKYSCIVHHGKPVSIQNPDNTTCWLQIDHMVNGVYDKATSGTICKDTGYLPVKGQGSTAKHYIKWNQQYDVKKSVVPSTDTTTPYIEKTDDDGTVTHLPAITVDGKLVQDGWIDGNGKYKGVYYQLSSSDAKANKLVGKINYASCMQSHKMGSILAYNDLYRAVMGSSLDTIMTADSKARCTCKEDWFFYFVQETEADEPRFEGIMTFGSGKMDKKTWGYDEDTYPDFGMFEGSDNDQPVTNFERPWNDDVTYNPSEEYYEYNGKGNIDFDAGATEVISEKEYPTGAAVTAIKAFVNFGYLYCTDILPWATNGGTVTSLITAADTIDTHKQYWITTANSDAARGDLYSWSPIKKTWVKAGINEETRNIFSENPSVTFTADYNATNTALIESILTRFKAISDANTYYNKRSCLFHSCFVQNLLAGSDNCAKNTYYVVDPTKHIINFHADDLDTIFKTDNVGWQDKPYYVDRVNHVDEDGNECYSGTHNMFFNTFDRAYEDEKAQMMSDIFTAMASISGSVTQFFEDYYFSIQRDIPCVAYLEQARIRYEQCQIMVNNNEVTLDTVDPITQQLGNQLESELQYMDRRLVYFESYAAYGEFREGGGGNAFGFRGFAKRDGTAARIAFTLKPHQYIYPTGAFGATTINPHVRLSPSDTYELLIEAACSSDTTCSLRGIDYYKEIGNIGDLSVNPAYAINIGGKRLTKVEAVPTSGDGEFRPSQISIAATLVESVAINCADVGQNLDLTSLTRLKTVDLQGTSLNTVRLPESQELESVELGSLITSFSLTNMPNLATFTLESFQYLTSVSMNCAKLTSLDTLSIAQQVYNAREAATGLKSITLLNVNWTGSVTIPQPSMVSWFAEKGASLSGYINSSRTTNTYSFKNKQLLASLYGNIDSSSNDLYLVYSRNEILTAAISGKKYISEADCELGDDGYYHFKGLALNVTPLNGNNVAIDGNILDVTWELSSKTYASFANSKSSELVIKNFQTEEGTQTVTATVKLMNGSTMTATYEIGFYRRVPKLGDFAYLDGSFDDAYDKTKDLVGIVYARLWYQYNPDEELPDGVTSNPILTYEKDDNDNYVIDPKARYLKLHIVSKEYMSKTVTGNTTQPVASGMAWGLYPDSSGSNGFDKTTLNGSNSVLGKVNKEYNTEYTNIFDTDIPNITTNGTVNAAGTTGQYAYADNMQGDLTDDNTYKYGGFREKNTPQAGSYTIADWAGKSKTKKIVDWAQKICVAYVGASTPKTLQELADYMYTTLRVGLNDGTEGKSTLYQFAFPAAYACYLYEPTASRTEEADIDDQYKANQWYLPAIGELERLYHHFNISRKSPSTTSNTANNSNLPSADYADYDTLAGHAGLDAWNPIFAKAYKRIADAGGSASSFANMSASNHWSSSEFSEYNAWFVDFNNSNVNGYGGYGYGGCKYLGNSVRPVAAYLFEL